MIDWQTIHVVFEGLDQSIDRKASTPGQLREAINVEFDKLNALNKRRGYEIIDTTQDTLGNPAPPAILSLATYQQELVAYGYDRLVAVLAIDNVVSGAAIVRRGPTMRGNYRIHHVFSSPISEDQAAR